jgi:hypothetical protein
MSDASQQEFAQLLDAWISGTASAAEAARLSALLKDNPELQDIYLDEMDVHGLLSWELRMPSVKAMTDAPETRPIVAEHDSQTKRFRFTPVSWIMALTWLIAVSATVVGLLVWLNTSHNETDPSNTFCRLAQIAEARWHSDANWKEGQRMGPQRLILEAGLAELVLDNGVRCVLAGPADLEFHDPMHAYLHAGQVVFHVPPPAIGFTLETADAKVMDLGTEFGVQAGGDVGTDVQIYQGEVVASSKTRARDNSPGQRLQSGQAVRFAKTSKTVAQDINFWPERFVRYLPDPNDPRAPDDPGRRRVIPYNRAQHESIALLPAPDNLIMDGSLEDWDLSGQFASHCEPPYDAFYHLRGAMMYDENFLYIAAEVGDPFPMRSRVSPWEEKSLYGNGGCLAFRLSTDRALGWPVRGEGRGTTSVRKLEAEDYNDKLIFLVLWYYEPEALPCLHVKYGMDQHGGQVNPKGYQAAYRRHDDGQGYTAEYAIPWSILHAADDPPRAGDVLGCTWLVHWAGPEGQNWKGQLIDIVNPRETGWNFQSAATWGRAEYQHPLAPAGQ